jgi:hypothetical protein
MLVQTNLKYKGWEHEKEWRLLIESDNDELMYAPSFEGLRQLGGHNRKFKYPLNAIKKVGFGNRFFLPEELHIINDQTLNVNLRIDDVNKTHEKKIQILDFLIKNNIDSYFAQRDGLIKISFRPIKIEKIKEYNYLLIGN